MLRFCLHDFDEALRKKILVGRNFCVLFKRFQPICRCHACGLLQCGRRLSFHSPSSPPPPPMLDVQHSSLVIIGTPKELLAPHYMCTTQVHLLSH